MIGRGLIKAQKADKENYCPISPKKLKLKKKNKSENNQKVNFKNEMYILPFYQI